MRRFSSGHGLLPMHLTPPIREAYTPVTPTLWARVSLYLAGAALALSSVALVLSALAWSKMAAIGKKQLKIN
ncbi:MAG: hypothetical protein EOO38_09035 [Cytophagaceae bacterium]|nr:MAG: hypothetical protein EOO38_09035 [Cytophagaceae bacterium]